MKLMTRDTDYAVRALCSIVSHKKKITAASDLVKELRIPRPFLRKILQVLNAKGLLKSYKGKGGGFLLAVPAEKIPVSDVMEIFQGRFRINECLFKKKICPQRNVCALRKKIDAIETYVVSQLQNITIASLLK